MSISRHRSSPRARQGQSTLAVCLFLCVATARAENVPTIGIVDSSCGVERDIHEQGGEIYAIKADGFDHADWQVDASAKGGPLVGLVPDDVSAGTFQILDNWSRPSHRSNAVFVLVTFPDGSLYVDSGHAEGFNYLDEALSQPTGSSPAGLPMGAVVALPDAPADYLADRGDGPEVFPRPRLGSLDVAFAPVLDLGDLDAGGCAIGGGAASPSTGAGILIGYNAYRLADPGHQPARAEIGRSENWQGFVATLPGADRSGTMGVLHDPDGLPYSGDEVAEFRDSHLDVDEGPRPTGTQPDRQGATDYWYAFQPVVAGDLAEWADAGLVGGTASDFRADLDGDGVVDAVDLDPSAMNGPEFFSPQAVAGLPGLGLTNGGLPLLSALVFGRPDPCPPADEADLQVEDLKLGRVADTLATRLTWSDRRPLVGPGTRHEVASGSLSTLLRDGVVVASRLATGLRATELEDSRPLDGDSFYYLVRATDPCGHVTARPWGSGTLGAPRTALP